MSLNHRLPHLILHRAFEILMLVDGPDILGGVTDEADRCPHWTQARIQSNPPGLARQREEVAPRCHGRKYANHRAGHLLEGNGNERP
jgi:hypothetical protein